MPNIETATAGAAEPDPKTVVAFQGMEGAYSHLACREALPNYTPLACYNFEEAFAAVDDGRAHRAMIPVENSVAGRVADIHHLLPESDFYIIGEHFQPVHHHLLAPEDASLTSVTHVYSHIHALAQCRGRLRALNMQPVVHADTAGACRMISESRDPTRAAIGSSLAAEIYNLKILQQGLQDHENNVTRFLIMARERITPHWRDGDVITTFMFTVKSVPAALYKALGGFATNGVNITKLESYMRGGSFEQAQFYMDIEGHPDTPPVQRALEELQFFTETYRFFGTYPQNPARKKMADNLPLSS